MDVDTSLINLLVLDLGVFFYSYYFFYLIHVQLKKIICQRLMVKDSRHNSKMASSEIYLCLKISHIAFQMVKIRI